MARVPQLPVSFHSSAAGARAVPWPENVRVAAAAGFDAVDVVLPDVAAEPPERIRERLAAAGLRVGGVPLPVEFRRDEATFRRELEALPGLARLAAAIGARALHRALPASAEVPRTELEPVLRARLSRCAAVLAEHGLDLALEPVSVLHLRREHPHEFVWRIGDAAAFAASCGANAGLLLDAWHWHHAGGDVRDVAEAGPLVRHVHVADAGPLSPEEVRDGERRLPGEGAIDLRAFFAALRAAGYEGAVTPEVFGRRCDDGDPVACAAPVARSVHAVLATE